MKEVGERVPLEELPGKLAHLVERVLRNGETILIETEEGEMVALGPVSTFRPKVKTEEDWRAFRAAAGSWADVDTDAFLRDIYASRQSSRPPVEL